jgi:hypothetical protein
MSYLSDLNVTAKLLATYYFGYFGNARSVTSIFPNWELTCPNYGKTVLEFPLHPAAPKCAVKYVPGSYGTRTSTFYSPKYVCSNGRVTLDVLAARGLLTCRRL